MKKYIPIGLTLAILLFCAQTSFRISGNGSAGLVYIGPSSGLPTNCNIGDMAMATDLSASGTIEVATAVGPCTWTAQSGSGIGYPSAGVPISTGSAWGTSITETDGDVIYGASGAWGKSGAPTISAANMTSFPTLNQSTTGNAATATALAATPTQCSGTGSLATGIAASGNANCAYPSQSYVQASLTGGNVTMTSLTGTFYDGPTTGTISTAGTWFVSGYVTLGKASATGQSLDQCKLWDGTTTFATAETSVPYVTAAAITYAVIHLNAVIVETGSFTVKISCENSVASGIIYYQTPTSSLANASSISAIRIQ